MADALCIAIVGAECTGKTSLADQLRTRLAAETGRRVAMVPEWLRAWCDAAGRTPRVDEQRGIAEAQQARIAAAARSHDIVVCDTTALMTAVYSQQVFGDDSLLPWARGEHARTAHLTLLMSIDLPWRADGLQRDGAHVREPVDGLIREALTGAGLSFSIVAGRGPARLERALAAVVPRLRDRGWTAAPSSATAAASVPNPQRGADGAADPVSDADAGADADAAALRAWTARRWRCECCVPEAEQALQALRASSVESTG